MSSASRAALGARELTGGVQGGTLAMTLVVRDEEDILETNLRYHLARGVDFIYALDHNSVDGTPDILRSFEQMGVLRMLREAGEVHDQAPRMTRLARMAYADLRADWVINNDADEFWWPAVGDLKDVFAAVPAPFDVLVARRHNFIPRPDGPEPFQDRMLWRHAESLTPTGQRLEPKVAHRGDPRVVVAPGNHDIQAPAFARAPALPLVEVLHFPARDYDQFVRKTLHTGLGYELLPGRDPTIGGDQLALLDLHRRGELRDYFDLWAIPDDELELGVGAGSIVRDARLRDYLALTGPEAHDRRQAQDVVAGAWAAELARERAEAVIAEREAERAEAERQLAARDEELAQVYHALHQLQNSRLVRSTRTLRRFYYRLR